VHYIISPPEDTGWQLHEGELDAAIREFWPDATTRVLSGPTYIRSWHFQSSGTDVELLLSHNRACIALDLYFSELPAVALWIRALVPREQPLLLYDDMYDNHMEMTEDTSLVAVAETFS
jgi:hypothetical protein